jgi:hypothetical protein
MANEREATNLELATKAELALSELVSRGNRQLLSARNDVQEFQRNVEWLKLRCEALEMAFAMMDDRP